MNDSLCVRRGKSFRHRHRDLHRLPPRQCVPPNPLAERFSFQQFSNGVRYAVIATKIMDTQNIGMRQGRNGFRFALKSRQGLRIVGQPLRQHFYRNLPVERGVDRPIDLAHPSGAKEGDDLVRSEACSSREAHSLLD